MQVGGKPRISPPIPTFPHAGGKGKYPWHKGRKRLGNSIRRSKQLQQLNLAPMEGKSEEGKKYDYSPSALTRRRFEDNFR